VEASDAALAKATATTLAEVEALKRAVRQLEVELSTAVGEEEVGMLTARVRQLETELSTATSAEEVEELKLQMASTAAQVEAQAVAYVQVRPPVSLVVGCKRGRMRRSEVPSVFAPPVPTTRVVCLRAEQAGMMLPIDTRVAMPSTSYRLLALIRSLLSTLTKG
jgi:hypothetical protein